MSINFIFQLLINSFITFSDEIFYILKCVNITFLINIGILLLIWSYFRNLYNTQDESRNWKLPLTWMQMV